MEIWRPKLTSACSWGHCAHWPACWRSPCPSPSSFPTFPCSTATRRYDIRPFRLESLGAVGIRQSWLTMWTYWADGRMAHLHQLDNSSSFTLDQFNQISGSHSSQTSWARGLLILLAFWSPWRWAVVSCRGVGSSRRRKVSPNGLYVTAAQDLAVEANEREKPNGRRGFFFLECRGETRTTPTPINNSKRMAEKLRGRRRLVFRQEWKGRKTCQTRGNGSMMDGWKASTLSYS